MLKIQENIQLAPFTTFRIGGPAKFFVSVESGEELAEAIEYAKENGLKYFILGGGSNLLVSDDGFEGLVIKIDSKLFMVHGFSIGSGAGVALSKVVKESLDREFSGMEWAMGIPGTVGGAIRGNAGAFGSDMSDVIKTVNYIDKRDLYEESGGKKTVKIKSLSNAECEFAYRESIFKQNLDLTILSAVFDLKKGDKEESEKIIKDIIKKRTTSSPAGLGSPGSFFKNPVVSKPDLIAQFESDKNTKSKNNKIPAGWLIERVDLLGKKIGGAMILERHGNFIVNTGNATAQDVIMLSSYVKQQVRDKLGVELHEEVQYVGF
ncbi:MAG TPA: UDP-N-acetylenolpyruvoylglucosamine reductase [Candidatus Moranbacteria bacterium]|nr:UDP-N-acetylenolpyruvoylglucosamine reductase [Candidatus Moranbacteria bacterium]